MFGPIIPGILVIFALFFFAVGAWFLFKCIESPLDRVHPAFIIIFAISAGLACYLLGHYCLIALITDTIKANEVDNTLSAQIAVIVIKVFTPACGIVGPLILVFRAIFKWLRQSKP